MSDNHIDVPPGKLAAVVTSLEMLSRPALRPEYPGDGWRLRQVQQADLRWFRDLFRRVGLNWLWFSRLRMSDQALASIIHDPAVSVYALQVGDRDKGLLELDFREPDVCELSFFGVTQDLVGTGAGRWLMNRAIDIAWSRPIRRFWVHTCTFDHPSALPFYIRSGFTAFRRHVEITNDPRVDGTLPRADAAHVPIITGSR
jgi:GNAT superfamily N-acetyltransferase